MNGSTPPGEIHDIPGIETLSPQRQANLQAWLDLASEGDPFLEIIENGFDDPLDPGVIEAAISDSEGSNWATSGLTSGYGLPIAVAAGHPGSRHRHRPDLLQASWTLIDAVLGRLQADGYWSGPGEGDANANRFILTALLGMLHELREAPGFSERWPDWRGPVETAVELQRRAYAEGSPIQKWDYGARYGGDYANMDATYIAILGQAAVLLDRPDLAGAAHRRMALLHDTVLPGGGLHYLNDSYETPNYHRLNTWEAGQYWKVTGDPSAARLLERMAPYLPTANTYDGFHEFWHSPHWKQAWMRSYEKPGFDPLPPYMLATLARHASGDQKEALLRIFWSALSRIAPTQGITPFADKGIYARQLAYAIGDWPDAVETIDLRPPEAGLRFDANRRGFRGYADGWYYGVAKGREQRSTLVGAVATRPGADRPTRSFIRGVWAEIRPEGRKRDEVFWLSPPVPEVPGGLAWRDRTAAVSGHYDLHPGRIGARSGFDERPWKLAQSWVATPQGSVGYLRVSAEDAPGPAGLRFQTAAGPKALEALGNDRYSDAAAGGDLAIRVLRAPGEVRIGAWRDTKRKKSHGRPPYPSLQSETRLEPGAVTADYAVWFGPAGGEAPDTFRLLELPEPLIGWTAAWTDGRRVGAIHNPSGETVDGSGELDLSGITATLAGQALHDESNLRIPPGGVCLLTP